MAEQKDFYRAVLDLALSSGSVMVSSGLSLSRIRDGAEDRTTVIKFHRSDDGKLEIVDQIEGELSEREVRAFAEAHGWTISHAMVRHELSKLRRDEFGEIASGEVAAMCTRLADRLGGSRAYAAQAILDAAKPGQWWPTTQRDLEEVARGR